MTIAIEIVLAAAAATAITEIVLDLGRIHRRAEREKHRSNGTGPYEPTHDIPRDVDMTLAIADHLRLRYAPIIGIGLAVNKAWRDLGLAAAAATARALQPRPEEIH